MIEMRDWKYVSAGYEDDELNLVRAGICSCASNQVFESTGGNRDEERERDG